MEIANDLIIQLIRKHSLDPDSIYISERAQNEIWHHGLTIYDVCDALIKWIDKGKVVKKDVTRNDPRHKGEAIYIFNPIRIFRKDYYVKVSFPPSNRSICMHLVSAHD